MPRRQATPPPGVGRPMPPTKLIEELFALRFVPAPELSEWARETFILDAGPLHNPDHQHLVDARIGFLWATTGFVRQGRRVLGMTEDLRLAGMGTAWKRARTEQQFAEWFGDVPDFLITLDGFFWKECTDAEACALLEHELYHVGHLNDEFGNPAFTKYGDPKLGIRGHDVEEFVGVVRRYGIGDPDSSLARLVIAAAQGPSVEPVKIAHACGNCLKA